MNILRYFGYKTKQEKSDERIKIAKDLDEKTILEFKLHTANLIRIRKEQFNEWSFSFKDKNPHYFKLFKIFYDSGTSVNMMITLYEMLKTNKHLLYLLPKNTIHYSNFDELFRNISTYIIEYKSLIEMDHVRYYMRDLSNDDKRKMVDLSIKSDVSFSERLYKMKKYTNFSEFLSKHNLPIPNNDHYKKYIDKYTKLVKQSGCDILYNKGKILIISVPDYKKMNIVGIPSWCIRKEYDWDRMINKKNTQLIIKDFNRVIDVTFGVTLNKNLKIKHVYDEDNDDRYKKSVKKYLKLIIKKKKIKKTK